MERGARCCCRSASRASKCAASERPPANLVFLIDVSGSMDAPDKLPLLKSAFRLLVRPAQRADRVSMVVYAGSCRRRARADAGRSEARRSATHRPARGRRLDQRRARASSSPINWRSDALHQGRHQSRRARDRRRFQRRRRRTSKRWSTWSSGKRDKRRRADRRSASARATTTTAAGDASPTRATATTPTSTRWPRRARCWSTEMAATLFTIAKDVKIQVEFNPAQRRANIG